MLFNFCADIDVAAVKEGLNSPQLFSIGWQFAVAAVCLAFRCNCVLVCVCVCIGCVEGVLRFWNKQSAPFASALELCFLWPQHGLRVAVGVGIGARVEVWAAQRGALAVTLRRAGDNDLWQRDTRQRTQKARKLKKYADGEPEKYRDEESEGESWERERRESGMCTRSGQAKSLATGKCNLPDLIVNSCTPFKTAKILFFYSENVLEITTAKISRNESENLLGACHFLSLAVFPLHMS